MFLVDTNVVVYLLLKRDRTEEARRLFELDSDWQSEPFLLVEFSNVLLTLTRRGALLAPQTQELLAAAARLFENPLSSVIAAEALSVALEFGVSAYDGRFLALAGQFAVPLITEDRQLRRAAPALTQLIAGAIAASR